MPPAGPLCVWGGGGHSEDADTHPDPDTHNFLTRSVALVVPEGGLRGPHSQATLLRGLFRKQVIWGSSGGAEGNGWPV